MVPCVAIKLSYPLRVNATDQLLWAASAKQSKTFFDFIAAPPMRIAIGSDHRGIHIKAKLVATLEAAGHQVLDVGAQ